MSEELKTECVPLDCILKLIDDNAALGFMGYFVSQEAAMNFKDEVSNLPSIPVQNAIIEKAYRDRFYEAVRYTNAVYGCTAAQKEESNGNSN